MAIARVKAILGSAQGRRPRDFKGVKGHMTIRCTTICGILTTLLAGLIVCSRDYNPFEDPENAAISIAEQSFSTGDTLSIFSTETLRLVIAVPALVDSFILYSPDNRLFTNGRRSVGPSPDGVLEPGPHQFLFSFSDTGPEIIEISTFRSNGDILTQNLRVLVHSPLGQSHVEGSYAVPLMLSTAAVKDQDAVYVWDFGAGTVIKSAKPDTVATLMAAGIDGRGTLMVTDGYAGSTPVPFSFALIDKVPPRITFLDENYLRSGDTIRTSDTTFFFSLYITDPGRGKIDSASINGASFDIVQDSLHIRIFGRMDTMQQPLPLTVHAFDNVVDRNETILKAWLVFDPAVLHRQMLRAAIIIPAEDIVVCNTRTKAILGTVENFAADSINAILRFRLNDSLLADTVALRGKYRADWSTIAPLVRDTNVFEAVVFGPAGDSLASVKRVLIYNEALIDTLPPVILEININGHDPNGEFELDSVLVRVLAFDQGDGIDSLSVGGTPATRLDEYQWTQRIYLKHSKEGNTYSITAVDKSGMRTTRSFTAFYNRHPVIERVPEPPFPMPVGYDYRDSMLVSDPDNDALVITKIDISSKLQLVQEGHLARLSWTPAATDTGMHRIRVRIFDGYVPVEHDIWITVVDSSGLRDRVEFATTGSDFPAYLEVPAETLQVPLLIKHGTGASGYQFTATIAQTGLQIPIIDNSIVWAPVPGDSGRISLRVTVSDAFRTSDTLLASLFLVPVNRPLQLRLLSHGDSIYSQFLDMSAPGKFDTLVYEIVDPDIDAAEVFTAKIQLGTVTSSVKIDSLRRFKIPLSSAFAASGNDTMLIVACDRVAHCDSAEVIIHYGNVPGRPAQPQPADSSFLQDSTVTLSWTCSDPDGKSLSYDLLFGETGNQIKFDSGLTNTSYAMPVFARSARYFWRIVASNGKVTATGPDWNFILRRPDHVRFATRETDFGAAYEALRDSVIVPLQVATGTGKLPVTYAAAVAGSGKQVPIVAGTIRWLPTPGDTGLNTLVITVTDAAGNADTILPRVLIAPSNRPFTVSATFTGDTLPGGIANLSDAARPETLYFQIDDPDTFILERHRIEFSQLNTNSSGLADSAGRFHIIIDPSKSLRVRDTVQVTIIDRAGHTVTFSRAVFYGNPPNGPLLPNPADNATIPDSLDRLTWQGSDPDGNPLRYDLYLGASTTPPMYKQDIPDTFVTLNSPLRAGTWYWRVVARDARSATSSPLWSVTVLQSSKKIVINTTTSDGGGAGTGTALYSIPVLVRLDSASLDFSKTAGDGSDIAFRKAGSGVFLPHTVERWDAQNETAVVWVLIDTVRPDNSSQYIEMLAGETRPSSSSLVFDTTNDFVGAWQLSEGAAGTGTDSLYRDATAWGHHGKDMVSAIGKGGMVGSGQRFDGSDDHIPLGATTIGKNAGSITLECWLRALSGGSQQNIFSLTQGSTNTSLMQVWVNSSADIQALARRTTSSMRRDVSTSGALSFDIWYHAAVVVDFLNDSMSIYVNGTRKAAVSASFGNLRSADLMSVNVAIGAQDDGMSNYFSGNLDALRISHARRSSDWIKFSYENQRSGSTVIRIE